MKQPLLQESVVQRDLESHLEIIRPISFLRILCYNLTPKLKALLVLGVLGSLLNAFALPLFIYLWGSTIDTVYTTEPNFVAY